MTLIKSLFLAAILLFADTHLNADDSATDELFKAIEAGDTSKLEAVIEAGVDINVKSAKGEPALTFAIIKRQPAAFSLLLEKGADVNATYNDYMNANALMLTVQRKDMRAAKALLEHGADVNFRDSNGDPAINWAAYYGYVEFSRLFLANGASTKLVGHGNAREIAMRRGHQPLIALLASHDGVAIPSPDTASLVDAVKAGDLDTVKDLLAMGIRATRLDATGRPIIAAAARQGDADILEALISAGATVDQTDGIGFTPLMEAAREGKITAVKLLLEAGADANHKSTDNALSLRPLHLAAIGGNAEIITMLVEAGADLDALGREKGTPLFWGLGEGKTDAAAKLLELGANPHIQSNYGMSATDIIDGSGSEKLKALIKPAASFTS
jgi:ankyrin repeat protein